MKRSSCTDIADLLVDYADRELAGQERGRVDMHLGECERCRRQVDALRRSLAIAGQVWRQTQGQPLAKVMIVNGRPMRSRPAWAVGVAAGILLLIVGTLAWRMMAGPYEDTPSVVSRQETPGGTAVPPTVEAVQRQIEEAGNSSRLLAAADCLAEQPGGREVAREQYRLIVDVYGGTDAAVAAQARLESRS